MFINFHQVYVDFKCNQLYNKLSFSRKRAGGTSHTILLEMQINTEEKNV